MLIVQIYLCNIYIKYVSLKHAIQRKCVTNALIILFHKIRIVIIQYLIFYINNNLLLIGFGVNSIIKSVTKKLTDVGI